VARALLRAAFTLLLNAVSGLKPPNLCPTIHVAIHIGPAPQTTLSGSKLSEGQREDTLAVAGQRDEEIDYSDIPPIREIPANSVRGGFIAAMPSI
jgi:hypothetical protein